jgi:hypothetical protein
MTDKQFAIAKRAIELLESVGAHEAAQTLKQLVEIAGSAQPCVPCNCIVKRTEVAGMGIIYARADCSTHGLFHISNR